VLWGLGYDTQLYMFRIGMWIIPALLFFGVRRTCRELQGDERIEEVREVAEQEAEEHEQRLARAGAAQRAG
jgi:hypothetical protein